MRASRPCSYLLFSFVHQSSQVDILLHSTYSYTNAWNSLSTSVIEQQCPNHPPGVCCLSVNPNDYFPFQIAEFQHLLLGDIAVAWMARSAITHDDVREDPIAGCSGIIAETRQGPGSWHFQYSTWLEQALVSGDAQRNVYGSVTYGNANHRGVDAGVVGASYISIPLEPKTDPDTNKHFMLEAQGIRGLAWGGGKWFADGFSMDAMSSALPRMLQRRYIQWPSQGTVYAKAPVRGVYPFTIIVNGTRYTHDEKGSLTYSDMYGTVLDLKTLGK